MSNTAKVWVVPGRNLNWVIMVQGPGSPTQHVESVFAFKWFAERRAAKLRKHYDHGAREF